MANHMNGEKFNLQEFLSEMREEQRSDMRDLSEKVDSVVEKVAGHETRIVVVENTRRTIKYFAGVSLSALFVAGVDILMGKR